MRFCFDLDGTLCNSCSSYIDAEPISEMIELLHNLKNNGHTIIIYTARHMKTCNGNVGEILAKQGKIFFEWCTKHNVPFDEVYFGKPCADFYIDDKAITYKDTKQIINDLRKIYEILF